MTGVVVVISLLGILPLLRLIFRDPANLGIDESRWVPPPKNPLPR